MRIMFAEIALDVPKAISSGSFTYQIPKKMEATLKPGMKVVVPFGKAKKRGIVIATNKTYNGSYAVKSILQVSTKQVYLDEPRLEVARWIQEYYNAPIMKVIKLFIPETILDGSAKEPVKLKVCINPNFDLEQVSKAPRQLAFLRRLQEHPDGAFHDMIDSSFPKQSLRALEKKGVITIEESVVYGSPTFSMQKSGRTHAFTLSEGQQAIIHSILEQDNSRPFLIHGVTGSGKTEVYMELIQKMLDEAKGVILLVPEIALTPQTIQRFKDKFPEILAVWHHKLTTKEKAHEWMRMKHGEARVLIGSRSALFQPIHNLGMIIIDEEHETSYKQDQEPRYHARDAAELMARAAGAKLVLGSATPNLTSFYNAHHDAYRLFTLKERFGESGLPPVYIVDMKREIAGRNFTMFSQKLQIELGRTLEQKNQAILFMNRRGAASSVVCRHCGWKAACPRCDIALTQHREGPIVGKESLLCHYCNYHIAMPFKCPECGGSAIKPLGGGTQKVVQELAFMFPQARILRADRDTTQSRESLDTIYNVFKKHEADILVGTQMIAKGWDIPNVRLVGIMMADIGLNMPDFMASERIFSVLTQVAGRAGRDKVPGVVVMQTYDPNNPTLKHVLKHDYDSFYEYEIEKREQYSYPPYTHLAKISYVDPSEAKTQKIMEEKKLEIKSLIHHYNLQVEVLGPAPNVIPKIFHKYHYHILLKAQDISQIHKLLTLMDTTPFRVDIDPLGF